MKKFYTIKFWILIIISLLIFVFASGIGMGVPIINIFLGFVVGWYSAMRVCILYESINKRFSKILFYGLFCSGITFILMIAIWGKTIPMLFNPLSDFENFGHPFILYDPKLSYIGWLVLMIIISPFLQLMATIFSAFITLKLTSKKN